MNLQNTSHRVINREKLRAQWIEYMLFLMVPRADSLYEGMEKLDYLFPFPGVKKDPELFFIAREHMDSGYISI